MSKELAAALRATLISPNVSDSNTEAANVVDALDIAGRRIARALHELGTGDDAKLDPRGAVEFHGVCVKEAAETVASAIRELAEAVRDHLVS